jgi:hypothetical protein
MYRRYTYAALRVLRDRGRRLRRAHPLSLIAGAAARPRDCRAADWRSSWRQGLQTRL